MSTTSRPRGRPKGATPPLTAPEREARRIAKLKRTGGRPLHIMLTGQGAADLDHITSATSQNQTDAVHDALRRRAKSVRKVLRDRGADATIAPVAANPDT